MEPEVRQVVERVRWRLTLARFSRELAWRAAGVLLLTLAVMMAGRWVAAWLWPWTAAAAILVCLADVIVRVRVPTVMQAALEVDLQWGLNELVSSALLMDRPADEFGAAVASSASQAVASLDLSRLNTGGYGARRWIAALLMMGVLPMAYVPMTSSNQATADGSMAAPVASAAGKAELPRMMPQSTLANADTSSDTQLGSPAASEEPSRIGMGEAKATNSFAQSAGASAGGGLATGGNADVPDKQPDAVMPRDQGRTGADQANSGAGAASAGRADAQEGTGIAQGSAAAPTQHPGGGAPSRTTARLWQQQIPQEYHDVLKVYFER